MIARSFIVGDPARLSSVIERVLALGDDEVDDALSAVLADYRNRHKDIRGIFRQSFTAALSARGKAARGR